MSGGATTFLLIRHASHDLLGKALAGRTPELRLSAPGCDEAAALATRLERTRIDAVYSSPQPRALDTAAPLATRLGVATSIDAAFDEIDFGEWTGCSFEALASHPHWATWVDRRSVARPPGGEAFAAVHARVIDGMQRLHARHPDAVIAVFSHGDVIKAALAHYLRMSLDDLERFEVAPASVSVVAVGDGWAQVKQINGCLWQPSSR